MKNIKSILVLSVGVLSLLISQNPMKVSAMPYIQCAEGLKATTVQKDKKTTLTVCNNDDQSQFSDALSVGGGGLDVQVTCSGNASPTISNTTENKIGTSNFGKPLKVVQSTCPDAVTNFVSHTEPQKKQEAQQINSKGTVETQNDSNLFNPNRCESGNTDIASNCIITQILVPIIRFLLVGVGVVVTVMIVMGGIQYLTSEGNPQRISSAKSKIINALIALALWAFMGLILHWLIPGGIIDVGLGGDVPNL